MTEFIKLQTPEQTIQIGFTDQKVSGRAGLLTFAGFLHWHRFGQLLARVLPHQRKSKKALPVADLALGFLAGILAGAQKLAQVAHLRGDVMLPALLAIQRIGSQSSFTRFFQGFSSAGKNLATFRPLWRWCLERLPSRAGGYALDLDSTRLLHEDGHQEGVRTGYTRLGTKPCLHPLLAVLEEAKLVVGFWLRPGNSSCANNVVAFTLDLLANLPSWIRLRVVRADSGFCLPEWLDLLETENLRYIVVARLLLPVQRLLKKELLWTPTEVPGTEVAEVWHQEVNWRQPRRLILLRHRVADKQAAGQHRRQALVDCPGYLYQALVTNLPSSVAPLEVWREYNARAGCEEVIKQLDADFAPAQAVPAEVLEHGGGLVPGDAELQSDPTLPAASGLDGPGHGGNLAVPALHDRGNYQSKGRRDDYPAGGAGPATTSVVVAVAGENPEPGAQLQFSSASTVIPSVARGLA